MNEQNLKFIKALASGLEKKDLTEQQAQAWLEKQEWAPVFTHADHTGWEFSLYQDVDGKHKLIASQDTSTEWFDSFHDLLVEVTYRIRKEKAQNPSLYRLRIMGWRCNVTHMSPITFAYLYNTHNGQVGPFYSSAKDAWAKLLHGGKV